MLPENLQRFQDTIAYHLPLHWSFRISNYNSSDFGDIVNCHRTCITFQPSLPHLPTPVSDLKPPSTTFDFQHKLQRILPSIFDDSHDFKTIPVNLSTVDFSINNPPLHHSHNHPIILSTISDSEQQPHTFILDPSAPIMPPPAGTLFHRFYFCAIPFLSIFGEWKANIINHRHYCQLFGIQSQDYHHDIYLENTTLCRMFESIVPSNLRHAVYDHHLLNNILFPQLALSDDIHRDTIQCYTITEKQSGFNWVAAYSSDTDDTQPLCQLVIDHSNTKVCTKTKLNSVNSFYRRFLKSNSISWTRNRLVLHKHLPLMARTIELIIVPTSLRRKIFLHYHASPSGGHVGEYKTLYRLRLRFIWPKMRKEIKYWCKSCAECTAANVWRSHRCKLYFSWPVTIPFWIMHVDIWHPGSAQLQGKQGYLLNAMCDLTQFVVSIPTTDISAAQLSQLFTEQVLLTFGMCAVIVVDDGSTFKSEFESMCNILKLHLWPLARGNHKGNSVERYHRYLNKVMTIQGNALGTNNNFHRIAKTAQYGWNSAPIDDTDVVRSLPAVGREFRFPLDIDNSKLPAISDGTNCALFDYLRDVSNESHFATTVLQILVEERRERHRNRLNHSATKSSLKVGDVVKAHVQVKSNASTGTVEKLSYRARGPFVIVQDLGWDTFLVQPYNKPDAATRRYKSSQLYLLPPQLFPSNPLDTLDQRYINYEHAPIVLPLQQALNIESYNPTWFSEPPPQHHITPDSIDPLNSIDQVALQDHPSIPSISDLLEEEPTLTTIQNYPEPIEEPAPTANLPPSSLHQKILDSTDKLFFIMYTPPSTLRPRWYLVQVDLELTDTANLQPEASGKYQCAFLAKHPGDSNKQSDDRSRWWPDWYAYSRDPSTNEIIYGRRTLFRPNTTPDSSKYILWADTINLSTTPHFLAGPFNFCPVSASFHTLNTLDDNVWSSAHSICICLNLDPPSLNGANTPTPSPSRRRRKRNQNN